MTAKIMLFREQFSRHEQEIYHSDNFTVSSFKYTSGIEALKITNSRGYVTLLPYYGQMIWDAEFDGHNLKMDNMFLSLNGGEYCRYLRLFRFPFRSAAQRLPIT